jgi:hypothetical protein
VRRGWPKRRRSRRPSEGPAANGAATLGGSKSLATILGLSGGELFTISNPFTFVRVFLWPIHVGFIAALASASAEAAAPLLKALEPRGAQRGHAFKLTLTGEFLHPSAEISTDLPGTISRLAGPPDKGESELPLLVQLGEDAAPGLYPVRLRTEDGVSNVLLFSVGTFPEAAEEESLLKEPDEKNNNDSQNSAQRLTLPVTLNGTLVGPDQDYYSFAAKAGEQLVFEVDARRAGSAIDPVVRVFSGAGKELAANNDAPGAGVDARVEVNFPQTGDYFVLVHDAKYSEQDQNFYRLKIGAYPYAESIFPLGWQRGNRVEVSFLGGNLRAPVKVKPDLTAQNDSHLLPLALPGSGSLPFFFRVGDWAEMLEPSETATKAADAVRPSEAGKRTRRTGLAAPARTAKAETEIVELPPSTVMNGRISRAKEVDKYRMKVTPGQHWAFEVEAASLGTSKLLGVLAIYDAQSNRRLALTELGQEVGTNPFSFESSRNEVDPRISLAIPGDVKELIVAIEDLLGRGGPNFGYRLMASPQPPDFNVELVTPYVNIPVNGTAGIEVLVSRRGYDGPIRLSIPNLPEGIVQQGGNIPAEMNPPEDRRAFAPGHLTLTAKPDVKVRAIPLRVWAEAVSSAPAIRKLASAPGMIQVVRGTRQKPFKAPWLERDLPAATSKALPFGLQLSKRHVRLVQGMDTKIQWKIVTGGSSMMALRVDPRATASIKDLRVLRKTDKPEIAQEGAYNVLTTMVTPLVTFDLVFDGLRVAGNKTERLVTAPAVTIEIVPGYSLRLLSQKLELPKGGKFELAGKIDREPGFKGIVRVKAEDLPDHVACPEVVVPADQTDFQLRFESSSEAKAGKFEVRVTSAATLPERTDKQEFKIPDLKAQLEVMPGPAITASN